MELGFIDLLAADPAYFKSIIPFFRPTHNCHPSFCELKNLNLSYSELTKVLADIQVGPQATPPGSPPSQVAQLTLQDEAGMLGLLDDRSFRGDLDRHCSSSNKSCQCLLYRDCRRLHCVERLGSRPDSLPESPGCR